MIPLYDATFRSKLVRLLIILRDILSLPHYMPYFLFHSLYWLLILHHKYGININWYSSCIFNLVFSCFSGSCIGLISQNLPEDQWSNLYYHTAMLLNTAWSLLVQVKSATSINQFKLLVLSVPGILNTQKLMNNLL